MSEKCEVCGEDRDGPGNPPAAGSADSVISDEVEVLLVNIAQILDVVKTEWGASWSPFDQEQRNHITKLLMAKRPPNDGSQPPP